LLLVYFAVKYSSFKVDLFAAKVLKKMKKEDVCCLYFKKVISFLTCIKKNKYLCANMIVLYRKILPAQLRADKISLVYYISL